MRETFTSGSVGRAPGNRCLYPEPDCLQPPPRCALLRLPAAGELGRLVDQYLSDAALLAMAEHRTGAFAESRRYYEEAKREGVDAPFVQYLTFPTLINIVASQGLYKKFGLSRTRFEKLGSLRELRNAVAHPARSLVQVPIKGGWNYAALAPGRSHLAITLATDLVDH
jgi:hypothetical protein